MFSLRNWRDHFVAIGVLFTLMASATASFAVELIVTPDPNGHAEWIKAIDESKSSVRMSIFNLTNPKVIEALKSAAARKVEVQVLFDGKSAARPKQVAIIDDLTKGGVTVRPSSPAFSIMHQKSMVVDGKISFITNMNLTRHADTTRDFGIILRTKGVAEEMERFFSADWLNADNKTGNTPEITTSNLLWSPINAADKLIALINSAQRSIVVEVENISYEPLMDALIAAQARGVNVRVITPLCNFNDNPFFNFPALRKLQAKGIGNKVMGIPNSADTPYMHAKMIAVDSQSAYVGSQNFSYNSLTKARELGVIIDKADAVERLEKEFEKDWNASMNLPSDTSKIVCPEVAK